MLNPLISVIIPVKNGDIWLHKVIPAILKQTLADKTEIIVIDSGSTDNTLALLSQFPVKVISIPSKEFNHGSTRNFGVKLAKGKYVVMTVQDAEPTNDNWLEHLIQGFDDEIVAGVCGQQVVPHDKNFNPVAWFRPISPPNKRKVYFKSSKEFLSSPASERSSLCGWDNVNAMYKREVLLNHPFREVSFAEDALWAHDIVEAGYSIVYNTNAQVNHYHHETPDFTFRRSFTEFYHRYKIFGTKPALPESEFLSFLRQVKLLSSERKLNLMEKFKWLIFNYNNKKALKASIKLFLKALAISEEELDRQHNIICKIVPQANKPITHKNDR